LNYADVAILYTDGSTEAENIKGVQYGLNRLSELVKLNRQLPAERIRCAVIKDVCQHIGKQTMYYDITLLVLKHKLSSCF